jgi:hypothetical protein
MWRPEGFKNPYYEDTLNPHGCLIRNGYRIFEAGADAMLEALKAKGTYFTEPIEPFSKVKGWIVCIPDESDTEGRTKG